MRNATKFGAAKSPGEEWDNPAWDRLMVRWAGDVAMVGSAGREGGAVSRSGAPVAMSGFPAVFDLTTLDGTNGFRIDGVDVFDVSGVSVSDAGDVNGDGFADVIIGAYFADADGKGTAGESYVVFGRPGGFPAALDLSTLDGTDGFRIDGVDAADRSGESVSSAGDVNGDGFDDVIIGARDADPGGDVYAGESYVVFGRSAFAASLDLAALDGTNGFRLDGVDPTDLSGISVSSAGDVNGDGFDDVIVGASLGDPGGSYAAGESYVVFGKAGEFAASVDLAALDGTDGFVIGGAVALGASGISVSSAGDFNGDGFDDILIGASNVDAGGKGNAGESYVVLGKADGFGASLDLATLDGVNGFRIEGAQSSSRSGFSVSSAGDINGDGFDDVLIGAFKADTGGDPLSGESYVVFGKADGFGASFNLAALDGSNGFRIQGADEDDLSGFSVSGAGDVNGDGFDDIIVGARYADPGGNDRAGESYVVFGKADGFDVIIDLSTLDGTDGFRLDGVDAGDRSGESVSGAGDVNGDGFDDIVIGAPGGDPGGDGGAGESYIIFGQAPTTSVRRIGSAADQTIRGGDFDDALNGRGGDDALAGAAGADMLRGGRGADDFLLASRSAADADAIRDFGRGDDRVALDGDVFGLTEGTLAPGRFVISDTAQDANDRLIYDAATGQLFFDTDGTGAQAQVLIATLAGAPTISAADFVVI